MAKVDVSPLHTLITKGDQHRSVDETKRVMTCMESEFEAACTEKTKAPKQHDYHHYHHHHHKKNVLSREPLALRPRQKLNRAEEIALRIKMTPPQARPHKRRSMSERKKDAEAKRQKTESKPESIYLPSKFKLGGNVRDPLNLRSMEDEETNKRLNMITPKSSPVPTPNFKREPIEVIIPPNISDPLNLEGMELTQKGKNSKRKKKKRRGSDHLKLDMTAAADNTEDVANMPSSSGPDSDDLQSPDKPKFFKGQEKEKSISPGPSTANQVSPRVRKWRSGSHSHKRSSDDFKTRAKRGKLPDRQQSVQSSESQPKFRAKDARFQYGNYNRYYGYRQPDNIDARLKCFRKSWFEGCDVLDVGCNVGFVTLSVARDFKPRRVIGIDIDMDLIKAARKNVRHYLSEKLCKNSKFPISLTLEYGPIAAPMATDIKEDATFPENVQFLHCNYVPGTDAQIESQGEEFDVILFLSVSKWVHLNWGDEGLKRTFKKMYKQLRVGGKLVLEAQGWPSYKKKKKMTETIYKNFSSITFKPEQFNSYLLSSEVGFSTCQTLNVPCGANEGFHRPIQVYTKKKQTPTHSSSTSSNKASPTSVE